MKRIRSHTAADAVVQLAHFAVDGSIQWELYWSLAKHETVINTQEVGNKWPVWYDACERAAYVAAVAHLAKFFESNKKSINIYYVLKLLEKEADDWNPEICQIRTILASCDKQRKDIAIVRSNLCFHRSRRLSARDVAGKISSTNDEIRVLVESMGQCVAIISRAVGGQEPMIRNHQEQIAGEVSDVLRHLTHSLAEQSHAPDA